MNERQFLLATRNTVRLEDLAADIARKIEPELKRILESLAEQLRDLPDESLLRTMQYKQLYQRLGSMFVGVNGQFKAELDIALLDEISKQVDFAAEYLGVATVPPAEAPVQLTQTAGGVRPTLGTPPPSLGPANFQFGGEITRTQLVALAQDTQVLGRRLEKLFALDERGLSPWISSNIKGIDRVVKRGFLLSETNEEIAQGLMNLQRIKKAEAMAVARSAVMDMSGRAHNAFYDANRNVIAAYEYSAVFDYRVCDVCAPWSGKTARKRSDLPELIRHPNCRCMVLPITETEWELRKEDRGNPENASFVDLVPGERKKLNSQGRPVIGPGGKHVYENLPRPKGRQNERFYAKPVFVDGKRYWRKRVDYPKRGVGTSPDDQMAEFLRRASTETKVKVMGEERAREFIRLYSAKDRNGRYAMTSHEAFVRALPARR